VIGNPPVSDYPSLPGAADEALAVTGMLTRHGYEVRSLVWDGSGDFVGLGNAPTRTAPGILDALFEHDYRIIHIASHGEVADDPTRPGEIIQASSGAIIGDDLVISATTIRQLPVMPELFFLNCCHLARVGINRLSAGIARELMAAGVRVVKQLIRSKKPLELYPTPPRQMNCDEVDSHAFLAPVEPHHGLEPIERDPRNIFATEVVNLYLDVMQYVAPHAPGFCILVRRDVHEAIHGFDETVVLAEDHDYVQRAAEHGRFRVLRSVTVATSMRRIEKEGLVRLAFKYLYCELYVVTGRPIREVPFDYEFANFAPEERSEARQAVAALRDRLGEFAEAVMAAPDGGLATLRRLGSEEISPQAFDRMLGELRAEDVRRLRRYVGARVRLARRVPRKAMASIRRAGDAIWRELTRSEF
jgi:hypothetical protein